MAAKSRKKKLLLLSAAVIAAAVLGAFIWLGTGDGGEEVNVYPFEYIGMTEFWGDTQESSGPVTTDKIQTEFLTDTQTITKVAVKNGDTVKQGDILFSFDTTLDALALERKRLEVEKVKAQIKAAEERLGEVQKLVPYVPAPEKAPDKESMGDELKGNFEISKNTAYDGSKPETALICWIKEGATISDEMLQELYKTAQSHQAENTKNPKPENEDQKTSASDLPVSESQNDNDLDDQKGRVLVKRYYSGKVTDYEEEYVSVLNSPYDINDAISYNQTETYWLVSAMRIGDQAVLDTGDIEIPVYPKDDLDAQQKWENEWGKGIELRYTREVSFMGRIVQEDNIIPFDSEETIELVAGQEAVLVISAEIKNLEKTTNLEYTASSEDGFLDIISDGKDLFLMGVPAYTTSKPVEYCVTAYYTFDSKHGNRAVEETFTFSVSVVSELAESDFYVVFKGTEKNMSKGITSVWQGAKVSVHEDGSFSMSLYDATGFKDHMLLEEENVEIALPEILPNQIYTADQIVDMQKQIYATIKEQTAKLRLAESEYAIMQREVSDGNVYAEIDGKVISLLTEEEAREKKQPMVKVSGGGGFYIEGSVSELEKASLKIGQEVTVNDWNNGNVYTGEVVSIGDFPVENNNWNGIGNPTVSYYPFKAFVSEEADLEADSHVSISYSTAAAENGIYLDKAFVRTEHGSSYIYVRGADGKLEKRAVQLGKLLWGSYYEVLSDLSEEDYLAFPYGKNVKQGAPTVESDISILYSY